MPRSSTWKQTERAIARILGGERMSNHALGRRTPDVETTSYSVEVKHRGSLPRWLLNAIAQAERNAPQGKLPLVILHARGHRHLDDLVVLRLGAFVDYFGDLSAQAEDDE